MVLAKIDEKTLRVKYLRALEKFANAAISALKKENFDKEKFQERMEKNKKIVEISPKTRYNKQGSSEMMILSRNSSVGRALHS